MELKCLNAREMNQKYPKTFLVPDADELNLIRPGYLIKVCLNRERFWIAVDAVAGDAITGRVDNELVLNPIPLGTPVTVDKKHVLEVDEN